MSDERYVYDVLEYHDYTSRESLDSIGQRIPLFGGDYEVVDVSPPIHPGRRATLVVRLYSGDSPEELSTQWPADWREPDDDRASQPPGYARLQSSHRPQEGSDDRDP